MWRSVICVRRCDTSTTKWPWTSDELHTVKFWTISNEIGSRVKQGYFWHFFTLCYNNKVESLVWLQGKLRWIFAVFLSLEDLILYRNHIWLQATVSDNDLLKLFICRYNKCFEKIATAYNKRHLSVRFW